MFRDALRTSPKIRSQYEALKLGLAKSVGLDRETYTAMKTEFVRETLERWMDST
jgi:GrpB-like predicted nucleotidyltransferase (UPF0157 family)